jgi:hypothetical protein
MGVWNLYMYGAKSICTLHDVMEITNGPAMAEL